jgi:hypothetical protein
MSNTNSKLSNDNNSNNYYTNNTYDSNYECDIIYNNETFNESLIKLQRKKLNKLRNKYNKMIKNIEKTDLEFNELKDEMNFLNTIYYLNQNIDDLNENIDNINLSLYQKRENDNIEISNYIKNKIQEEQKMKQTITDIFPFLYNKIKND